ncbi:MAG: hypothetical protein HQ582_07765, partial [Planctomycetes bacterium]|nr:hypothetical protein [Planctomycetota bacterium]
MNARRKHAVSQHRRTVWRLLVAAVVVSGVGGDLRGEGYRAGDLAELAAACDAMDPFFAGNTILVGEAEQGPESVGQNGFLAFPEDSSISAYEEHAGFVYAEGDASGISPVSAGTKVVRRFISLKPGIFVVDDLVRATAPGTGVRWMVGFRSKPTVAGGQVRLRAGDEEIVCETLWPAGNALQGRGG